MKGRFSLPLAAAALVAALAGAGAASAQVLTTEETARVLRAAHDYVALRQPGMDVDALYPSVKRDGDDYIVTYSADAPGSGVPFHYGVIIAIGVPDLAGRALAVIDLDHPPAN